MTLREETDLRNRINDEAAKSVWGCGVHFLGSSIMEAISDMPETEITTEHEKVELPKDVAEYLKDSKTGDMSILYALSGDDAEEDVRDWLQYDDNQETFAKAWLYGYKEKEPLYVMPVPYATHNMYYAVIPSGIIGPIGSKIGATKFTLEEINEYFPKIAEFKEEVAE